MASNPPATERPNTPVKAVTYTSSSHARLLHVSLTLINDLISLLTTLPSSFEEYLARVAFERREADCKYRSG